MYQMIKRDGIDKTIEWFREKGKKAKWGGTNMALAEKLIEDGRVEDGLRLIDLEIELSPEKVWLFRRAAEAYLANGYAKKALEVIEKGLELKPDGEKLLSLKWEAERATPPAQKP